MSRRRSIEASCGFPSRRDNEASAQRHAGTEAHSQEGMGFWDWLAIDTDIQMEKRRNRHSAIFPRPLGLYYSE
ncbi:hypothetical protein J31TS4_38400 [Paenibacillus sp. J31TS4]|nr:hypothetical protein J31TS4_38400 [Paenibacillus sp. J31TS4]